MENNVGKERYTESEMKSMPLPKQFEIRDKCVKEKNLMGLIDVITYFFKNGAAATVKYHLPSMTFLYARAKDIDTLNSILQEYSWCFMEISKECRDISLQLLEIGLKYPYLDDDEVDFLEDLYCNPKYCSTMDIILYDKECLPRPIKGITREDLKKTHSDFPQALISQMWHSMERNESDELDHTDDTHYDVYVRLSNSVVRKKYEDVGDGEHVIQGLTDSKRFLLIVLEEWGEECMNYFIEEFCKRNPYLIKDRLTKYDYEWIQYIDVVDFAKSYFKDDKEVEKVKEAFALAYLKRVNNID